MKVLNCQTLGDMCEFMLDGEPVFLLRSQNDVAVDTVKDYIRRTEAGGGKNVSRSKQQLKRMEDWQKAHPDKVGPAD